LPIRSIYRKRPQGGTVTDPGLLRRAIAEGGEEAQERPRRIVIPTAEEIAVLDAELQSRARKRAPHAEQN